MSFLQAYKEWIKRNGEEPRLPALNYTNEQLFFISAAQVLMGELWGMPSKNTLSSLEDLQIVLNKTKKFSLRVQIRFLIWFDVFAVQIILY